MRACRGVIGGCAGGWLASQTCFTLLAGMRQAMWLAINGVLRVAQAAAALPLAVVRFVLGAAVLLANSIAEAVRSMRRL
jgi:hypothetical protein